MSLVWNIYDNAFMESCLGTFKTALDITEYENCQEARREIDEYIACSGIVCGSNSLLTINR
jgi:putative transposase